MNWIVQVTETAVTSFGIQADTEERAVELVLDGDGWIINQVVSVPELSEVFEVEDD